MNTEQIKLALKLIQSMDKDEVARADTEAYGNWYDHLTDHLSEIITSTKD